MLKLTLFANLINRSIVKRPTTNETNSDIIINGSKEEKPLKTSKPSSPIKTVGIARIKLILKAFSALNPSNNNTEVVIPLLLTPGRIERP